MPTINIRTQDGYRNELIGGSGVSEVYLAADAPATISDNVQVASLSNTGGAATAEFTVPSPASYTGSSQGLFLFITAQAAPQDVALLAPAGVTIGGVPSITGISANTLIYLFKVSDTEWGIGGFTA